MQKYNMDGIDPKILNRLVDIISNAVSHEYSETMDILSLRTKNCKHFLLWDIIHKALLNSFHKDQILSTQRKRGPWEFVLLYDPTSNTIFSFIKQKRFKELQKAKAGRKVPHYLDALVTLNNSLQAQMKQGTIFEVEGTNSELKEKAAELLDYLCADFASADRKIVANHVLICFSNNSGMLTSINACVLDNDFDVVEEKDLSKAISFDIGAVESQLDKQRTLSPKLKLSEKALARASKSAKVGLKTNIEDESKNA